MTWLIRIRFFTIVSTTFLLIASCDPSYDLQLINQGEKEIVVMTLPAYSFPSNEVQMATKKLNDENFGKFIIKPKQEIRIGTVIARYNPEEEDLKYEYLEIQSENDTITLYSKKQIFEKLEKEGSRNWRLIIQ